MPPKTLKMEISLENTIDKDIAIYYINDGNIKIRRYMHKLMPEDYERHWFDRMLTDEYLRTKVNIRADDKYLESLKFGPLALSHTLRIPYGNLKEWAKVYPRITVDGENFYDARSLYAATVLKKVARQGSPRPETSGIMVDILDLFFSVLAPQDYSPGQNRELIFHFSEAPKEILERKVRDIFSHPILEQCFDQPAVEHFKSESYVTVRRIQPLKNKVDWYFLLDGCAKMFYNEVIDGKAMVYLRKTPRKRTIDFKLAEKILQKPLYQAWPDDYRMVFQRLLMDKKSISKSLDIEEKFIKALIETGYLPSRHDFRNYFNFRQILRIQTAYSILGNNGNAMEFLGIYPQTDILVDRYLKLQSQSGSYLDYKLVITLKDKEPEKLKNSICKKLDDKYLSQIRSGNIFLNDNSFDKTSPEKFPAIEIWSDFLSDTAITLMFEYTRELLKEELNNDKINLSLIKRIIPLSISY